MGPQWFPANRFAMVVLVEFRHGFFLCQTGQASHAASSSN